MPALSTVTVFSYLGIHTISHDLIRKLFVAEGPDGEPVQISEYLRNLITDVFEDVQKGGFHVDVLNLKEFKCPKPVIRWFASSTIDPIVFGMTDFATGISIGVPNSYNYQKPEDLPNSVFEIKKLAILRSPQGREFEKQSKDNDDDVRLFKQEKHPVVLVRKIDKDSEEGKDYIDSLLLSENAKKFSIARELYVGDSYRPALHCLALFFSLFGALTTSRAYIDKLKLRNNHITHRLPVYAISGILGYGMYTFLNSAIDDYIGKRANERAKSLGDNYVSGAEEYFRKQAIRDNILGLKHRK
jgi:hypothetical protein